LDSTGGNLYVANTLGNKIIKIPLTTAFPNGSTFIYITNPHGEAFDNAGNFYVSAGYG